MKKFILLAIIFLAYGCKMDISDNFFVLELDEVSNYKESDKDVFEKLGFKKDLIVKNIILREDSVSLYLENRPMKKYAISKKVVDSDQVMYFLEDFSHIVFNKHKGNKMIVYVELNSADIQTYSVKESSFNDVNYEDSCISLEHYEIYQKNGFVKGPVKNMEWIQYEVEGKFGDTVLTPKYRKNYKYNNEGNVISYSLYKHKYGNDSIMVLENQISYIYDNKLLNEIREDVKSDYYISNEFTQNKYDSSGQLINKKIVNNIKWGNKKSSQTTKNSIYSYSDNSIIISNYLNKTLDTKIIRRQTSDGFIETFYDSYGNEERSSEYDSNGLFVSGLKEFNHEYAYDFPYLTKIKKQKDGNIIIERTNHYSINQDRTTVSYSQEIINKNGNVLQEDTRYSYKHKRESKSSEATSSYYYIYDNKGNWTKRLMITIFNHSEGLNYPKDLTLIDERIIEY